MSLVRCKLGYAETIVGSATYVFQRDRHDRFVAQVGNPDHVNVLVSAGTYEEVSELPDAVPPVADRPRDPVPLLFIPDGWLEGESYAEANWLIHNGAPYQAKVEHVAAPANEPGVGAEWPSIWDANAFGAIASPRKPPPSLPTGDSTFTGVQTISTVGDPGQQIGLGEGAKQNAPSQPPPAPPSTQPPTEPVITDINGIGPSTASKLAEAGFTTVAQIAALTPDEAKVLDELLNLRGRIERDGWVEKAKALIPG